jgi:hypothetical protein
MSVLKVTNSVLYRVFTRVFVCGALHVSSHGATFTRISVYTFLNGTLLLFIMKFWMDTH